MQQHIDNNADWLLSHFPSSATEQKYTPQPGHPRGAGGHPGAARAAPPPAESQTATGNDCPTARRAGPAHAAEPGAPQRRAIQAAHRGRRPRSWSWSWSRSRPWALLSQWQGSEGSLKTVSQQRQERRVRRGVAFLLSGSTSCCLDIEFMSSLVNVSPQMVAVKHLLHCLWSPWFF